MATNIDVATAFETPYLHTLYNYSGLSSPTACKVLVSVPDTLTFDQAMQDTENREAWKEAMMKEIQQLEDHGT